MCYTSGLMSLLLFARRRRPMQSSLVAIPLAILIAIAGPAAGNARDAWSVDKFRFAAKAEGASILTTADDYVAHLSQFDRSARLKTDKPVSESEFLAYAGKQTLDWGDGEKARILEAVRSILDRKSTRLNSS